MTNFKENTRIVLIKTKDLCIGDVIKVDEDDWRVVLFKSSRKHFNGKIMCSFGNAEGYRSTLFYHEDENHQVVQVLPEVQI